ALPISQYRRSKDMFYKEDMSSSILVMLFLIHEGEIAPILTENNLLTFYIDGSCDDSLNTTVLTSELKLVSVVRPTGISLLVSTVL
ncbi:MAG: hypothetical protein AAGJ80_18120, partial [Cyanobacteria bacterium J06553_1]